MLRRCASIGIDQEVALPPGWPKDSQRIAIELSPYARELDEVFAQCGEEPVYAAATPSAPQAAKPSATTKPSAAAKPSLAAKPVAPKALAPAGAPNGEWRRARTVSKGTTNIRSSGGLDSQVAANTQLPPGMPMLVQPANADWWQVKPRSGEAYHGFIRRDRFVFD